MVKVTDVFGSMVFNDKVMYERLSPTSYKALKATIDQGTRLDPALADEVAEAMKNWAIEKGATHYTHWFQPMTGVTAEKHDSFVSPAPNGGMVMEFSGKELIKGEPDASSFPNGGLRATFEARGYTSWDPTSYAFVKDDTLCIPTAFLSYGGEVLDKKTPLLRSIEALNTQALRVLHLLGKTNVKSCTPTVGPEQEYFLVDRDLYKKRKDLLNCGRTLFGARPPKGQEMDDHYYGTLRPKVIEYMEDLDQECWKLGIYAKTRHNEVAPAQHELAIVYTAANMAIDHNQLTMETMRKVACKHNLICLLAEKPFAGINGSGKHNNWSLSTDTGVNLLNPGDSPENNDIFLLTLAAVIKAVDEYQDLLRCSVAIPGNDHRLGAQEAPPAIISIFLGDELTKILEAIAGDTVYTAKEKKEMLSGVKALPAFPKDSTDRNRTSPFAFTGNKFEFRMPGSSMSLAGPNIVINTIVAESLRQFADELEKAKDKQSAVITLIKKTMKEHRRIIFNGNNYSADWQKEAKARGLSNYPTTVDALPHYSDKKNLDLFTTHHIFTETEVKSREDIRLDGYCKTIAIEARTMLEMTREEILPAIVKYENILSNTAVNKENLGFTDSMEKRILEKIHTSGKLLLTSSDTLEKILDGASEYEDNLKKARYYRDKVIPAMEEVRKYGDKLETMTDKNLWPFPTYEDLVLSV